MRRTPSDDYDVRVSVRRLEPQSLAELLRSLFPTWIVTDLAFYLRRRTTIHVCVLALASAVLAGSAITGQRASEASAAAIPSGASTDSLALNATTAIIARAIPFTSQSSEASYEVQAGDNLGNIAESVSVNEEALLAYNGFVTSDALSIGLRLRIPDVSRVPVEQLRLHDTAPHESMPLVTDSPLPPQKPSPELSIHEIRQGDTVFGLALQAGVTEASILTANDLNKFSILSLGQRLVVPSLTGSLVTTKPGDTITGIADKYDLPGEALIAANNLNPQTQTLVAGATLLVPADPTAALAGKDESSNPAAAARPSAAAQPVSKATTQAAPAPKPTTQPVASGGFSWPAAGYIGTYFSSWHNGIDIVNSVGTPVRAAQSGVVTYSGWDNSGYGYMVRINHSNGLQTLYGHASRLLVRTGEAVDKGEVIMLMGSTGRSTGSHVHFSIFQGGSYSGFNPLKYLP